LRKLMLLGVMLAILVVASVPAIAEGVSQGFSERRITSGKAAPQVKVTNTGDNANLCPSVQQPVNTGNVANEQGVVQYFSTADDIGFSGSSITIEPSETAECTQTIEQASATGQ
jgi:hypothetical protein